MEISLHFYPLTFQNDIIFLRANENVPTLQNEHLFKGLFKIKYWT